MTTDKMNYRDGTEVSGYPADSLPLNWTRRSIGELATFVSRGITPKYDDSAPGLVINQKCIRNGRLSLEPARHQTKEVPREKLIRVGDILVNSTGEGTLGRVAQVCEELENCTVDSHVTIVRPGDDVDHYFLGLSVGRLHAYFASQGRGARDLLLPRLMDGRIEV
jgi:type I restriction enzyme S subunit